MPVFVQKKDREAYVVTFTLNKRFIRSAYLLGNFNAFQKSIELEYCSKDSICTTMALPPGRYNYYYEIDGEKYTESGKDFDSLFLKGDLVPKLPFKAAKRHFSSIYQIFVDRFLCVRKEGDRLGSNLYEISEKLRYVRSLGFDAVYLTPIFRSDTYHRYDVRDYFNVDDDLGGNTAFKHFLKVAHELGLKVILDIPLHHTSDKFWAFNDRRFSNWYYIKGGDYDKFDSVKSMPKINYRYALEYFKRVLLFWQNFGVDAFRIDVASGINPMYLWEMKKLLNIPMIGEVWGMPYLWRDSVDGVMNYEVYEELVKFLKGEESNLCQVLRSQLALYSYDFLWNSWLFLGTHDTARIFTLLNDIEKVKAGLVFIYTWVGTPMVYYGDEIAMKGGNDPDNRRCMEWGKRSELQEFIRRLRGIGQISFLKCGKNTISYGNERIKVEISNKPIFDGKYYRLI